MEAGNEGMIVRQCHRIGSRIVIEVSKDIVENSLQRRLGTVLVAERLGQIQTRSTSENRHAASGLDRPFK
jgi:hypothetical protein